MDLHYTSEKNSLILISLLKAHGIRNIIASPGATNLRLVASLQHDSYFKIYSNQLMNAVRPIWHAVWQQKAENR